MSKIIIGEVEKKEGSKEKAKELFKKAIVGGGIILTALAFLGGKDICKKAEGSSEETPEPADNEDEKTDDVTTVEF